MKHYSPVFITLHWITAALILLQLSIGDLLPARLHLVTGTLIGVLMFARLVVKWRSTSQPVQPEPGRFDRLAAATHQLIYGLVFAVVLSGITLAIEIDAPLFLSAALTASGFDWPLLIESFHFWLTDALALVIAMHVLAALFHQFILKDNLFARMRFGKPLKPGHLSHPLPGSRRSEMSIP